MVPEQIAKCRTVRPFSEFHLDIFQTVREALGTWLVCMLLLYCLASCLFVAAAVGSCSHSSVQLHAEYHVFCKMLAKIFSWDVMDTICS